MAHRGRKNADDALAAALAAGATLRTAAAAVGMGERTATRRWADPAFQARVSELQRQTIERALGRLADAMTDAADELRKLLKAESENVRLGACRALLELGPKLRDAVQLEARLVALEQKAAAAGDR